MNEIEFKIGNIVRSKQGRDASNLYAVKEVLSEQYLFLVDGKEHFYEKPKRKNKKHVQFVTVSDVLTEKFTGKNIVQDTQIRKILKSIEEVENV